MTNIAKAIVRLREERRDAQNQVQKLGEAISVLEKLTRGAGASARGSAASREACSLRGRAPENLFSPESSLGEDQTNQESSLTAGRAAGSAKSSCETEARRILEPHS
jgi:hypothetical protein